MMLKKKPDPCAADLRDAILKRMGPIDGCSYAPGVAQLLDAYVAKLKEAWEFGERLHVEDRYRHAIAEVLARPSIA